MNSYWIQLLIGLGLALVTWLLAIAWFSISPAGSLSARLAEIMGGRLPEGLIQFFTYVAFWFGIVSIQRIFAGLRREDLAYSLRLLPEQEQFILDPREVNEIKLRVLKVERDGSYLLTDLIKKACTKFRANKSVSETMDIVSAQVRINQTAAESGQSLIRYVAWAIPSIGFIGTILGIAASLGSVQAEMGQAEIGEVTQALKVAFDTTLLSLVLSIILMFYFHVAQERVERFHADMEAYVIENLINRIYK